MRKLNECLSEVPSDFNSVTALCFNQKPSNTIFFFPRESLLDNSLKSVALEQDTSRDQGSGCPACPPITGVSVTLGCKKNENVLMIH